MCFLCLIFVQHKMIINRRTCYLNFKTHIFGLLKMKHRKFGKHKALLHVKQNFVINDEKRNITIKSFFVNGFYFNTTYKLLKKISNISKPTFN